MAPDEPQHRHRVRHGVQRRQREPTPPVPRNNVRNKLETRVSRPEDLDALRTARPEYLEKPINERRNMLKLLPSEYVGQTVTKTEVRTVAGAVDGRKKRSSSRSIFAPVPPRPQRRHDRTPRPATSPDDDHEYVYGPPLGAQDSGSPMGHMSGVAHSFQLDAALPLSDVSGTLPAKPRKPRRRHTEPLAQDKSLPIHEKESVVRSHARTTVAARPPPKRRATQQPRTSTPANGQTISTGQVGKSSLFSGLFRPAPSAQDRKVTCLTCGSDVRVPNTAKLICSHRMCHGCLKRIFSMSVNDPAHMPPKCCTSEHIPLKHVDKLFDDAFKKTWNRKYQEYNTRNRIYCPSRGCGEWIKPHHINLDHGRKVGKCKRCGTRVCCICNNRMHTSRDCPKDPETKRFVEVAKEKGWQRCFSCSAMVELKEGCNHMTCRCTAEFCMVCGLKWKSCDCPWFNYEQVDVHLGNPARYQEELDLRRDQERRDEDIARRMEVLGLDRPEMLDRGNAVAGEGQHVNQNFIQQAREALTTNYQQAEQAAWGLFNGLMTGRENRSPMTAEPPFIAPRVRQQGHRHDPAENGGNDVLPSAPIHRPTRPGTSRRHSGMVDVFSGRSVGR